MYHVQKGFSRDESLKHFRDFADETSVSMARSRRVLLGTLFLLVGCGSPSSDVRTGFVNRTRHSDAQLWALWKAAQLNLARSIDLNPLQQSQQHAAPVILPGDISALQVFPQQVQVTAVPDAPSQTVFAATGIHRADPTGLILCPQPCNVIYAAAYSLYRPPLASYAASWEFSGTNFDTILEYEFENQILYFLGYDVRWR